MCYHITTIGAQALHTLIVSSHFIVTRLHEICINLSILQKKKLRLSTEVLPVHAQLNDQLQSGFQLLSGCIQSIFSHLWNTQAAQDTTVSMWTVQGKGRPSLEGPPFWMWKIKMETITVSVAAMCKAGCNIISFTSHLRLAG